MGASFGEFSKLYGTFQTLEKLIQVWVNIPK